MPDLASELERYGSTREQLVDLAVPSPRGLRFADLMQAPPDGRAPVVVESNGRVLIYVFDGRQRSSPDDLCRWVRRIAFRGDADWLGVLRPGRLDVYPAALARPGQSLRAVPAPPRPLEDLPDGGFRLPSLLHRSAPDGTSIRSQLRTLLFESMKQARGKFSLSDQDALALVGRALFWRFVVDRGLLDRLEPAAIIRGPMRWQECFDRKRWAIQTFNWLDVTFNGGLLEFETHPARLSAEAISSIAGRIAHKTDASGQLSLPASWAEVDFAHVPVGLLSEVYEAFVHDADGDRATERSLFYTPRHLAEYVVDEALSALDDVERPRILDPAAGAGVFLVVAFRALIMREWERSGTRPSRAAVRRVLNRQLTGFDIDGNALRLAELALYLTAIELDPERNPQPLDLLKFAKPLRGTVLVEQPDGRLVGSLGPVKDEYKHRFDAVIGNPPWTASKLPKPQTGKKQAKQVWVEASRGIVQERLGAGRAKLFKFPDANPDLPFLYRAMEWCKDGGVIALITHARWLFGQSGPAVEARKDVLQSVHVTGILNGAALRMTKVWPNVDVPFCILFAANERPPAGAAFQFVSPDLDTADLSQDGLRIDWRDAQAIEVEDVVSHPWSLKVRFRGNAVDESVLRAVGRRGQPLGEYLASLGTKLVNGYRRGRTQDARSMWHLRDLYGKDLAFVLDGQQLPEFRQERVDRKRGASDEETAAIYRAPLLIVHESVVVDRLRPRAGIADFDVAYDERFDGVSFSEVADGRGIAAYLQVVLQSAVTTHLMLMLDGQFGVEREVVHKETLEQLPVVPWHVLRRAERNAAARLSARLQRNKNDAKLQVEIDAFIASLHGLDEAQRDAISDTLDTGLTMMQHVRVRALSRTTESERAEFAKVCQLGLMDVLAASELSAWVRARDDLGARALPWRFLQIDRVAHGEEAPNKLAQLGVEEFVQAADTGHASLVLLHLNERTSLVGILDRRRHWTRTRARLLASMLLEEMAP